MRFNVLASVLLAVLPLVSAAATPVKDGELGTRAEASVNTSDSISLASNDGNFTPAGSDSERRACPSGYGVCPNYPDICCPLGGWCCSNRRCCPTGYYCYYNSIGVNRCCPQGQTCI